jgi:hypothetical protein
MKIIERYLPIALACFFLTACGATDPHDSAKEKATLDSLNQVNKQSLIDSVTQATEAATLNRLEREKLEKEKQARLAQEARLRAIDKTSLQNYVDELSTEIEVQEGKLEDIKSPKFLRTISEKESRVRDQLNIIKSIKQRLNEANEALIDLKRGKKYELPQELRYNVVDSISF